MRRISLAAASLSAAWFLFHPFVAAALWFRGDEFLRRGDPYTAARYYARAVFIDRSSAEALDRFAISALEIRTPGILKDAVSASEAFVNRHPRVIAIRIDLALALWALHQDERARTEFRYLAAQLHDSRFAKLAGLATRRSRGK